MRADNQVTQATLVEALGAEAELLQHLNDSLLRQRAAVAEWDHAALEAATRETEQILRWLAEVQHERREVVRILTGGTTAALAQVVDFAGEPVRDEVTQARSLVEQRARDVSRQTRRTRRLLARAAEMNARLMGANPEWARRSGIDRGPDGTGKGGASFDSTI